MEPLGVLRRIDELGRIVIPKGIRNRLKINEGDRVELILDNESDLIVRKFSSFQGVDEITKKLIINLEKEITLPVLLCSNEKILAVSNEKNTYYEGESISHSLFNALNERKNVALFSQTIARVGESMNYVVYPMAKNSELLGGIVILGVASVNEYQNKIILIFRNIIMSMLKV
ncbi:MAG: AbrB/MazE/SpoVT family DNA-binding domain-containing protein [Erysipelotrichales bacterium]|nr:AbrB/MazE/SpoVT family DNA-binding domain-containing protein [Erysipelotrichales bacterium]